ncbi:MAG TPA: prepilin-type cleavage/methylation domain-containing protein [Acidobacteriaceae bacterium]|jgi:type IV pilus assembly protein PilA
MASGNKTVIIVVVCLVVVGVLFSGGLIVLSIAIPAVQKTIRQANETSAIMSLRTLNSMEGQYSATYPKRGFACSLATLGGKPGSGQPTQDAAQLINGDLANGVKSGYTFNITCGAKKTADNQDQFESYTITAVPNAAGKTGIRGYCTDENAVIRFDPSGGTNCTELLQ